jgi:integrase
VSTIERRLSALTWNYAQRGHPLDRKDRHIPPSWLAIRNTHAASPRQKKAVLPEDLVAVLEMFDRRSLCGLRDRVMLLLGFAGGLRRSEVVGLDVGHNQTEGGRGWVEILDKGMLLHLQNRLARGRSRARLVRCHLPCRGVGDLARVCAYRTRAPVPAGQRPRQGGRCRSA